MNNRRAIAPLTLITTALALAACTPATPTGHPLSADPFLNEHHHTPDSAQSTPTPQAAPLPELRAANGTLNILIDDEAAIPQTLIDDFTELTGVHVHTNVINTDAEQTHTPPADLYVGFDNTALTNANNAQLLNTRAPQDTSARTPIAAIPAAIDYAHDDICILADRQWYAANATAIPNGLETLTQTGNAEKIVLAPETSDTSTAFTTFITTTLKDNSATWLTALKNTATTPATWEEAATAHTVRLYTEPGTRDVPGRQTWVGTTSGPHAATTQNDNASTRPLRLAPLSLAGRTLTNTGTQSYLTPVPGTCTPRTLYVAASATVANPDAAEAFTEYLTSTHAQRILAATGAAQPLDPQDALGTLFAQLTN